MGYFLFDNGYYESTFHSICNEDSMSILYFSKNIEYVIINSIRKFGDYSGLVFYYNGWINWKNAVERAS